ncbi:sulfurtransferase [Lysobacter pythonis]|uniref:Sulfurtransferase n=1 Tax=Solilutibacter pythonis TaxID=2483112 RepID=A0A3M2HW68_9GAMM|nr:rhodanese-like domain-containing protein [Lysobacter pythonis]RMH93278.1 sulfurtransferase [Lysobacter pythonis]
MALTAADLVADARGRIREVSPADFHAAGAGIALIDVREPAEFETGHLQGAINIPRGVLEFQVDAHPALAHRERPLALYCRTGGRSALAADTLRKLGFSDVRSLAGGIDAWRNAGLPLGQ